MDPVHPLIVIGVVVVGLLTTASLLVLLERRLLALWQDRYGPNRVGPLGLLQMLADTIKMLTKEDWVPPFADKAIFVIAPTVIMATVLDLLRGGALRAGLPGGPTSTSACCFSSACPRSGSTAWRSPAGRRTTNIRCSAASAPPPR